LPDATKPVRSQRRICGTSLAMVSCNSRSVRRGDALARGLPRGYDTLQDQLRRALLSAHLGIAEASSRQGADRLCRFRCARRAACAAEAALEGVLVLNLAPEPEILTLLVLLDGLCAMLTRLAHIGDRASGAGPA